MNISIIDNTATMTSYDFMVSVINPARVDADENPVKHDKLLARIRDELDGEGEDEKFSLSNNRTINVIRMTPRQMLLVGMRESKAVRRKVLEYVERLEQRNRELEQRVALIGLTGVSRAGATWGDYCKAFNLPAHKLISVLIREGRLFRVSRDNCWQVNPKYKECFQVIKPSNNRFSPTGINVRLTQKGLEVFSQDDQLNKMRRALERIK
ncbi:TPA: hypothetical protein JLJ30_000648 [Escherichia coli]|nr:hypothetical protein [Escherichia coli]